MIDSHIHLFEHGYRADRPPDDELMEYARYREQFGISSALVVGYEGDALHHGNNHYLAGVATRHEWVRPLAYLEVERGRKAIETLADLPRSHFVGVSLYVLTDSGATGLASWTTAEWAQVPEPGIASVNIVPALLPKIAGLAATHPHITFMISHFGSPPAPVEGNVASALAPLLDLAPLGNVHVKASGYYAMAGRGWQAEDQAAATAATIDAFGQARVHWGSDFSPCLEATTFAAAVSPPSMERFSGRTMPWLDAKGVPSPKGVPSHGIVASSASSAAAETQKH